MGFSLTGTHVVYFIASVIIASAVSGVLVAVTNNVNTSLSETGDRVQTQLDTDFKIVNDPNNIPNITGYYRFYIKNIGGRKLETTNTTFNLFVDGEIISTAKYNFSEESIQVGDITTIYVVNSEISSGDHDLRVVGPQAVYDEFEFKI
jgi:flagellar protein FlaG